MKKDELIFGRILDEQEKLEVSGGCPIAIEIVLPTFSGVGGNGNIGTDDTKTYSD